MNEYIVSARKYRPMTFDSVVGQSALTTTLKNAVKSGKLAHAYLFCGPRGVGKTTCARIFAKAINCLSPTADGEACNECESCKAFNEQRSYNIFELDAASNNSVESIKQLMEQTRIPPQVGRYKVFIIDEVHMLSTAAFNAFLKTLEEPPAHVVFILATTEKNKILPTILSRCQIYDFERMTVQGIVNHLKMVAQKEGFNCEEEALNVIAEKADGGMRDALSIFDQAASFCQGDITYAKVIEDLNVLDADYYFKLVDLALGNKVSDVMLLLNDVISKGFDAGNLALGLASHIRNVLMAKDASTLPLLEVSESRRQKYEEQAKKCPTTFLYRAMQILNRCDVEYKQSSNKRFLVELTLIEVAQITQKDDTDGASAGRRPRRLKTLFKLLALSTQSKPASQVAGTPVLHTSVQQKAAIPNPSTAAATASSAAPATQAVATMASPAQATEDPDTKTAPKVAPTAKLKGIGMTFANLRKGPKKRAYTQVYEIENKDEDNKFTQAQLDLQWLTMCNRMPHEMVALATSMKNMKPRLLEFPKIEVVVSNQILLDQLRNIKSRIKATLARDLHNGQIELELRLAEPDEIAKILTPAELLKAITEENPSIAKLRAALDLELN